MWYLLVGLVMAWPPNGVRVEMLVEREVNDPLLFQPPHLVDPELIARTLLRLWAYAHQAAIGAWG